MTHLIFFVVDELSDILNIHVFIITRKLNDKPVKKDWLAYL
jgi:hypothetical protein